MNKAFDDLNDDLSDLIGAPSKPRTVTPPPTYQPRGFDEPCPKCRGTGRWRPGYPCFACKGKGKKTFKTAPETRAAAKESRAQKEARQVAANVEGFQKAFPEVWAWMDGNPFPFAVAMVEGVKKFGGLTPNQMAACYRMMEKLEAAKAASTERKANAPEIAIDPIVQAFERAKESGSKKPVIRVAGFKFSLAPVTGANAGAIYVQADGQYRGKIRDGKFLGIRECTPDQTAEILKAAADPKSAAIAYGRKFGCCSICKRELSDPESIAAGIGPVCSARFGW